MRVDGQDPNYWETSFYQWIHKNAPRATPFGSLAVYWDLPGQTSYLPQLVSYVYVAGQGTAAVKGEVTIQAPGPQGPVQFTYPQQNTVFKVGGGSNPLYTTSFFSTDPAQPFFPGIPSGTGRSPRFMSRRCSKARPFNSRTLSRRP